MKYYYNRLPTFGVKCAYTDKYRFLSEGAVRVAIRAEGKIGKCAPYWCRRCKGWHMTSDEATLREHQEREQQRRKNRVRDDDMGRVEPSSPAA